MIKRTLALLFCIAMFLTPAATALAASKPTPAPEAEAAPRITPEHGMVEGVVQSFNRGKSTVDISTAGGGSVQLQFASTPIFVDNDRLIVITFAKLRAGTNVRAFYTGSIAGGRANALVMLCNIEPGAAAGEYFQVEWVGKSGGTYKLLNQQKDLYLNVPGNVKIVAAGKGAESKANAVKPGARFLYWVDEGAEKGTTKGIDDVYAKKIVMLPYPYDGYIIMQEGYVNVNGYMLDNQAYTDENGVVFLPIMQAAKRMGFATTNYDKAQQRATLKKGGAAASYVFTAGQAHYLLNGKHKKDCTPPVLQENMLYVPLNSILEMGNYKLILND